MGFYWQPGTVRGIKVSSHFFSKLVVGAPGFEPGASCAQGRRATRLRYAPTWCTSLILLYVSVLFLLGIIVVVRELRQGSSARSAASPGCRCSRSR